MGILECGRQPGDLTAEIQPVRNPQWHFDVTKAISQPACKDCIKIIIAAFDPFTNILDADVKLKNPTPFFGHDVRGIVYTNNAGFALTNPDSWTGLFDIAGGDTINPFRAFGKIAPARIFPPNAQHMETFRILVPQPTNWLELMYAAEASWPANCEEPYSIHTAGYYPDIIAPSCTAMGNNVSYFNQMVAVSGAVDAMTELSYHRYGQSYSQLLQIVSQAEQYGLPTSMLEWWNDNNGLDTFLEDLKVGMNTAWEQGAIGGPGVGAVPNNGMSFYVINTTDPLNPVVDINKKTRLLRQYYLYVRRGAVRIDAVSANPSYDPLAFINKSGDYVVVIKADAGGEIPIQGLPPADYSALFASTTDYTQYDIDIPVESFGGIVTVNIPGPGVVTVYK